MPGGIREEAAQRSTKASTCSPDDREQDEGLEKSISASSISSRHSEAYLGLIRSIAQLGERALDLTDVGTCQPTAIQSRELYTSAKAVSTHKTRAAAMAQKLRASPNEVMEIVQPTRPANCVLSAAIPRFNSLASR